MLNLFLGIIFSLLIVALAQADESVIGVDAPIMSVCNNMKGESDAWYDKTHTYLSVQFCEPAAWFDGFFADDRVYEEFRPGTRVRWQHDYVHTEGAGYDYATKISASFKLPNAKKNINLLFEGEEEESLEDVIPDNEEEIKADLGLLYEIRKNAKSNLSLRIKLSPSATVRYRYTVPFNETFVARYTQELFRRESAYGATSRLDFEKKLENDFALRQSTSITASENRKGAEWIIGLILYKHLSDVSAFSYESGVAGETVPERYATNFRLGVRYRRNFFRKWLFYEVAPAITWPRLLPEDQRQQVLEILFRLEVNFINL